ncbi:hypothetical protein BH23THE1_BH23THE1_26110 [soil metagenome]
MRSISRKYHEMDGGKVSIKLEKKKKSFSNIKSSEDQENNVVNIIIKDNGEGLDPAILPKLFTKFTTKSSDGNGLGLYISKKIIEAHGGKIWAGNIGNREGVEIIFSLPLAGHIAP